MLYEAILWLFSIAFLCVLAYLPVIVILKLTGSLTRSARKTYHTVRH